MADPVTMALGGAAAGALLNKDDPLKGAALGGFGGYLGGSFMPGMMGSASAAPGAIGATEAGLGGVGAPSLAMQQAAMAGGAMPSLTAAAPGLSSMGGYAVGAGAPMMAAGQGALSIAEGGATGALGMPGMQPGAVGLMGAATPVSGLEVANGGRSAADMLKYGRLLMPNQQQQQRATGGSAPMPRMSAGGQAFAPYGPSGSPVGMPNSASRMVFGR